MYPGYRFADAYPHQRNPMPTYMPNYYPGFEPPEMKMDLFRTPSTFEAWPHGGCHGCCNHSYMPGYTGFRPPYPPHMQPPPFHGYGGYPMHYMPPPHYPMTQPRYEYDKPMDHHCCGCSNHQFNRKEDKPVRIEEQEPETEKGKNGNTSLVPVDFHKDDYPYPVMWIPPGYMKNGENKKLSEPETKNPRPSEHKPDNTRGVWFPFDIKNLGGAVENGKDLKRTEEEKTVDKNQFPFPIFWMPYKPVEEEEGKEKTEAPSGSESTKTLPTVQSKSLDERSGVDGSLKPVESKLVKLKTIPVKQLEEPQEKEMKERDNAVKSSKPSSEKKPSPPNTSKLPPVCLRVEPLKRSSRSVGSRSPSPPGDKEKSPRGGVRSSSSIMEKTRDVQQNEGNGLVEEKKPTGSIKPSNAPTEEGNVSPKEAEKQVMSQVISNAANESCKEVRRKNLSEEEAAPIIQAAFRGFGVRKWEPLKKLKQIASVKEQAIQVKNRIEDFELSGDVSIDNKQKLVIGETIMSLLLKLDTIQGLHPTVREIRKSVAKELVSLQEKLDSLSIEKPDAPIANPVVGHSMDSKDGNLIPEEEKEAEAAERNIEDDKSTIQADFVQGEELQSIPNVEEKNEDEIPLSPLGHGEELQSSHAEDGEKGEVQQKDEMLNLAAGENVDYTTPPNPAFMNQELAIEETQRDEKIESCGCKVVEESSSPQEDKVVAAEDMSKPEDGVIVKENGVFYLPSTEERNVKVYDEASNTSEVTDVTQPQVPRTEESCTELSPELASVDGTTMDAPKLVTSLEEDVTSVKASQLGESQTESALGVPQTLVALETTEAPTSEVPLEENGIQENGICLGDASQLEEPNSKDESFQDKEVIEEAEIESGIGAEHVQSAEEVPIQVSGEDNKEPLQEEFKLETGEENLLRKSENDQKLLEENQRLKKMMQELIEAGKDQLSAITDLSGKVKYLERKLARKKKVKTRRTKSAKERIEDIGV